MRIIYNASLAIMLIDILTKQPVKEAVILCNGKQNPYVSKDDGYYVFCNLIPGKYNIYINATGYVDKQFDVSLNFGETKKFFLELSFKSRNPKILNVPRIEFSMFENENPIKNQEMIISLKNISSSMKLIERIKKGEQEILLNVPENNSFVLQRYIYSFSEEKQKELNKKIEEIEKKKKEEEEKQKKKDEKKSDDSEDTKDEELDDDLKDLESDDIDDFDDESSEESEDDDELEHESSEKSEEKELDGIDEEDSSKDDEKSKNESSDEDFDEMDDESNDKSEKENSNDSESNEEKTSNDDKKAKDRHSENKNESDHEPNEKNEKIPGDNKKTTENNDEKPDKTDNESSEDLDDESSSGKKIDLPVMILGFDREFGAYILEKPTENNIPIGGTFRPYWNLKTDNYGKIIIPFFSRFMNSSVLNFEVSLNDKTKKVKIETKNFDQKNNLISAKVCFNGN